MYEEMMANANGSILVDPLVVASYGIPLSAASHVLAREHYHIPLPKSIAGSIRSESVNDEPWYAREALQAPLSDALQNPGLTKWFWWFLEVIFLKQEYPDEQGWKTTWWPHWGKRRVSDTRRVKILLNDILQTITTQAWVHRSVKLRYDSDPVFRALQDKHQPLIVSFLCTC